MEEHPAMMDDARLFRRTDPDFPVTRAVQQRLVKAGRVEGEGPLAACAAHAPTGIGEAEDAGTPSPTLPEPGGPSIPLGETRRGTLHLDLNRLLAGRCLIQGSSGAGKSMTLLGAAVAGRGCRRGPRHRLCAGSHGTAASGQWRARPRAGRLVPIHPRPVPLLLRPPPCAGRAESLHRRAETRGVEQVRDAQRPALHPQTIPVVPASDVCRGTRTERRQAQRTADHMPTDPRDLRSAS